MICRSVRVGIREAMIAVGGLPDRPPLGCWKKPQCRVSLAMRSFGLRLHHEHFGRYMIFGFALRKVRWCAWAICSISA